MNELTDEEKLAMTGQIASVHKEVMDLMGWDEKKAYKWMAAACEELDDDSPAGLIIDGKYDKLKRFMAGMKKVVESLKDKGQENG